MVKKEKQVQRVFSRRGGDRRLPVEFGVLEFINANDLFFCEAFMVNL